MLGEGFQLDSSLSYHSEDNEGIEGDLDVVIPLLNLGRHVLFVQPGAVFWTGLEEEERIDGNIGLVYRAELTRGLIAGASVFYDHDFQIGHSRASGGVDLQSGFFRLGANYYHPLSETEDGREGFVEEALRGGDLQFAFERDVVRLGSTIGYWEYDGGEDVEDEWKTSFGLDFGVRILPGVFAEASWERHKDNIVLDERIFAGLAFRFSLPYFEGASYGDGSMSANLYKIVDREKRILYEEREAGPRVLIALPDGVSANVAEDDDNPVSVEIRLSEALEENVVINLVGSGTAEYGSSNDYTVSVDGTPCTGVTEDDCQVTIAMGETSANVMITVNEDGGGEDTETIILSMVIDSAGDTNLMTRDSLALTIPADPPLPTVSLSADATSITEGNTATITLTLSDDLGSDATFNLIGSGGATYGTRADWNLSIDGFINCSATQASPCQVTIPRGERTAEATVEVNTDTIDETTSKDFTVSVEVDSGSIAIVQPGSRSSLNFTIPADLPNVSFNYTGRTTNVGGLGEIRMTIELSEALSEPVTLHIVGTGSTATYGLGNEWDLSRVVVEPGERPNTVNSLPASAECSSVTGSGCSVTLQPGATTVDVQVIASGGSSGETIVVSVVIPSPSDQLVKLGSPPNVTLTF